MLPPVSTSAPTSIPPSAISPPVFSPIPPALPIPTAAPVQPFSTSMGFELNESLPMVARCSELNEIFPKIL